MTVSVMMAILRDLLREVLREKEQKIADMRLYAVRPGDDD